MKDFIFVSDFDGTLTERDFYHVVIDHCADERGQELANSWQRNELTTFDFLAILFREMDKNEAEIMEMISQIRIDDHAIAFIKQIRAAGGDFAVLSAGADYYIHRFFAYHGLAEVKVIANTGVYQDKGIVMTADETWPFYSSYTGVDKGAVIQSLRHDYKRIFFAGDSRPDIAAAMAADLAFAKGELIGLLQERDVEFIPVEGFDEIAAHLRQRGVLAK